MIHASMLFQNFLVIHYFIRLLIIKCAISYLLTIPFTPVILRKYFGFKEMNHQDSLINSLCNVCISKVPMQLVIYNKNCLFRRLTSQNTNSNNQGVSCTQVKVTDALYKVMIGVIIVCNLSQCLSHPRLRMGNRFWNFQRQGGMENFQRQEGRKMFG